MIAEEAYFLSQSFTKKSLEGQGALKGAPCTIKSITEVDGGQKVTFEWTGTSGTKQTSEMTVKNGVSVTGISDKGNGVFTLLLSDGSETDPIQCVKGEDGFSPTATVEKVGKVATITITDKNGTTTATIKDGEGSEGGEANAIDSISVNGVNVEPDENKNVDITVPSIDGLAKTEDIPTKVSELTNDSGYLTEHQDISGKVDKVEGKSLISDTEIERLASVDNYDDTDIRAELANKADATAIPSKVSVLENDSKYQTESDVTTTLTDYATKTYVGEQIANAEHLKREIVTVLPSDEEASDNIIYMLKVESATGNDKYQEYMKIDGIVQMVGDTSVDLTDYAKTVDIPTTVAELTDSTDYAKKTDIPTTLPADGGNSDTVNNHTVKSDVPENAVFTDTIYDDTEVKESIAELSSNLVEQKMLGWNVPEECPVQNYVDGDGVFHQRVGRVDLGSLDWNLYNEERYIFHSNSIANIKAHENKDIAPNLYVKGYTTVSSSTTWTNKMISMNHTAIYICDTNYATVEAFKNAMKGVYLYYELAAEITKTIDGNEAVEELSSNLDGLGYGENGAKNLFEDEIKWMENITVTRGTKSVSDGKITLTATSADCYTDRDGASWKNNGIKTIPCKPNTTYTLSWEYEGDSQGDIYIFENGSTDNMSYGINKSHKLLITTSADAEYLTVRVGVSNSGDSVTYWNFQLEEGGTATPYEPYIPSVKMLADENAQQNTEEMDLKMLGWTVPEECPVQNYVDGDGVFHQRVGRVDLGSLEWTYDTLWKATSGVSTIKNLTVNMYHSVYVPTIASVSDMPTNSVKKVDSGTLWINNGSSTEKPSGYLYYELAEEKTISVDGNEAVTKVNKSLSVIGKCKNLLNPTLQTTTLNGVTCTNNGDGTYTINGTATQDTDFTFFDNLEKYQHLKNRTVKLVGCPKGGSDTTYRLMLQLQKVPWPSAIDIGKGSSVTVDNNDNWACWIRIYKDTTVSNLTFKPMLVYDDKTPNATFDDFVPYTGDGETLASDVAEIKKDLGGLTFSASGTTLSITDGTNTWTLEANS